MDIYSEVERARASGAVGILSGVFLFWAGLGGLHADSPAPSSYVVDLANTGASAYPAWLKSVPADGPTIATTEVDFAVTRPEGAERDLLLTVIFDEKAGGFLRVYRKGPDQARTLAENLFEGSGTTNQRTLLVPAIDSQLPTTIAFQSSAGTSPVLRLVWEWPQTRQVPVVRASTAALWIRHDAILTGDEVSGQPLPAPPAGVEIDYTLTPLLDQPVKIDGNAVFKASLDRLPSHVRLAGKVAGLPLAQQLECWINGQRAGVLALSLPSLRDPAYLLAPNAAPTLAAWRLGSLYLPGAVWNSGENQIELRPAGSENGSNAPDAPDVIYALKDMVLEFIYDDGSAAASSTPPSAAPAANPSS